MANPILVEVTRGALVESIHRGAIAIADASGALIQTLGDVEAPVYPRSSLKPIQALPLVESGAADAFGLGGRRDRAGLRLAFRRADAHDPRGRLAGADRLQRGRSRLRRPSGALRSRCARP